MERAHRAGLLRLYSETRDKVFLLGQFNGRACFMELTDPYDGTLQDFQYCFKKIRVSCDSLIQLICSGTERKKESR